MNKKDELENENKSLEADNKESGVNSATDAAKNTKKDIFTRIKEFTSGKTFYEILKYVLKKLWEYLKFAWVEFAVIAGAILLDLVSKGIIDATMEPGDSITLIPKFLNFHYTQNTRAAFGSAFGLDKLLGDKGALIFLIVFTFIALIVFLVMMYAFRKKSWLGRISIAMIIGGAIGNLVDRIAFGYVRDFVEIEYFGLTVFGSKTFAIFNLADSFLVVGLIMFAIFFIFKYNDSEKQVEKATASSLKSSPETAEASGTVNTVVFISAAESIENGSTELDQIGSQADGLNSPDKNADVITEITIEKKEERSSESKTKAAKGKKNSNGEQNESGIDFLNPEGVIETSPESGKRAVRTKSKTEKEDVQADDYD